MGSSTKTTNSTQQTAPYEPAKAGIDSLLGRLNSQIPNADLTGTETGALNTLAGTAAAGNPYANSIGDLASQLLAGGGAMDQSGQLQGGLDAYRQQLNPYASGSMVGNNAALQNQLNTVANDVSGRVNSMFAGGGRSFSGANLNSLARGIMEGSAPILANQYNQDVANQLNAAGQLYGAGNTTSGLLSGLRQQDLQNRSAGIDASTAALQSRDSAANRALEVESMRRNLPVQNYSSLLGTIAPVGQAFGKTSGTQTTNGGDNTMGSILGGVGLLGQLGGFGNSGWLLGSSGSGLLGGLGSGISGALGSAGTSIASMLPLLLSDERAKEDIHKVGKLSDGQNVYSFKYKADDSGTTHIGLMAQEVEKRTPGAVHEIGGVKLVDYEAATRKASKRAR